MKIRSALLLFLLTVIHGITSFGQDTLPDFAVRNVGKNRIVVSWTNKFQTIRQLSIQRSYDSIKGFKTILTMADPTTPQNGYVDNKAPDGRQFYRLFIMLEGGTYMFSRVNRPVMDTLVSAKSPVTPVVDSLLRVDSITRVTPLVIRIGNFQTGDSSTIPNAVTIKNQPSAFVPSLYVYTNKDGYVKVNLPEEGSHKYDIRFYDEENNLLFELKDVKKKSFKIDKANFFHAGWFRFELYEDSKLLEKHKFYLESDF